MTPPRDRKRNKTKAMLPSHQRNLFRICMVTSVLLVLLSVVSVLIPLRDPGIIILSFLSAISVVCTIFMGRRWSSYWVPVYYLLSISAYIMGMSIVTSIPGALLAALGLLTVIGVSPLILPDNWVPRIIFGATILSGTTLIIDHFYNNYGKGNPKEYILVTCYLIMALLLLFIISQFSKYSILTKVIVARLGVAIVIAFIIFNFITSATAQFHRSTVGEQLHSLTQLKAMAIGSIIGRQVDSLGILALNEVLRVELGDANYRYSDDTREQQALLDRFEAQWHEELKNDQDLQSLIQRTISSPISHELQKYMDESPNVLELLVVDRYGALIGATNVIPKYSQKTQAWWQIAFNNGNGSTYISLPEKDPVKHGYTMEVAIPVRDRVTQEVAGVLKARYDVTDLEPILFEVKIGMNDRAALIFPGAIASAISESGDLPIDQSTISQIRSVSDEHFAELDLESHKFLISQTQIFSATGNPDVNRLVDNLGWVVVFAQPMVDVMAPINQNNGYAIILAVAIIVVSMLGGIWITNLIINPIFRLQYFTERVAHGELDVRVVVESEDETGKLAEKFNAMADQLHATLQHLESRVEERTRAIELSSDIGRRLSTLLDKESLVSEVVELLQFAFNYYYVQIYLLKDGSDELFMEAGTGEAGVAMLERNHTLKVGEGLVGLAAKSGGVILVTDINQDPRFVANPLLPDTISEVAVPILIGDHVIGVLDIQHNISEFLNNDHIDLLISITNQIASALQNARMYENAQKRALVEAKLNEIIMNIQNCSSIEDAIQTATTELGRVISARTTIQLKLSGDVEYQQVVGD